MGEIPVHPTLVVQVLPALEEGQTMLSVHVYLGWKEILQWAVRQSVTNCQTVHLTSNVKATLANVSTPVRII